jgi:hypothetical protein
MSKMSEIDMMITDAVDMVENDGVYLSSAMIIVAAEWALDAAEFDMVYREASARVYDITT